MSDNKKVVLEEVVVTAPYAWNVYESLLADFYAASAPAPDFGIRPEVPVIPGEPAANDPVYDPKPPIEEVTVRGKAPSGVETYIRLFPRYWYWLGKALRWPGIGSMPDPLKLFAWHLYNTNPTVNDKDEAVVSADPNTIEMDVPGMKIIKEAHDDGGYTISVQPEPETVPDPGPFPETFPDVDPANDPEYDPYPFHPPIITPEPPPPEEPESTPLPVPAPWTMPAMPEIVFPLPALPSSMPPAPIPPGQGNILIGDPIEFDDSIAGNPPEYDPYYKYGSPIWYDYDPWPAEPSPVDQQSPEGDPVRRDDPVRPEEPPQGVQQPPGTKEPPQPELPLPDIAPHRMDIYFGDGWIDVTVRPDGQPDQLWERTRRKDDKKTSARHYAAVMKFVSQTFGTASEVLDFVEAIAWNLKVDGEVVGHKSYKEQIAIMAEIAKGNVDVDRIEFDFDQFKKDIAVMLSMDAVVGGISSGAAKAAVEANIWVPTTPGWGA